MQSEPHVNILLVDDQPENLLALEAVLESLGENLVRANSGQEALRCLLNQDFAVILLDVQMPEMDGFETATLIRSRSRSRTTPIIFLTAFSTSDQMMFKGYALGAVDYLFKPLNPDILKSKVTVFVDLFKKTQVVQRQAAQLIAINKELGQSEERFRSLSACSPVGIFVADSSGRCTYINPRAQAICGLPMAESISVEWLQSVHPEDREQAIASWLAYTADGQEYSQELRFQTLDGSVRWTQVRSSPMLSGQCELLAYVGTVEDITERKQAECVRAQVIREQAARLEAEAANQMKDEFLAILSHELRTPLNSMLGWSRLLRSKKLDQITINRALETIERNAVSQSQLIEDILDVSKIIQGKLRLNCSPVNLVYTIKVAIESIRPLADAKGIELNTVCDDATGRVWGDSTRLQQVLSNLLTNAIKFTPDAGRVEVRLSEVSGEELTTDNYAQIQVIDTGIGISPNFLPKVFERFRQADSTTTRSYNGLGLGLAIVRYLVELHGGVVQAASPGEGLGSTFTVLLPLLVEGAKRKTPVNSDSSFILSGSKGGVQTSSLPLDGIRVLVVDDEADNLDLISFILEQHGAIVTPTASALSALKLFSQEPPDLLVSDIGMPEMDGYMLIRQIRARSPQQGGEIPAIALTAFAGEANQQQMLLAGFGLHIAKPIEPDRLVLAIASLVGRTLNASVS